MIYLVKSFNGSKNVFLVTGVTFEKIRLKIVAVDSKFKCMAQRMPCRQCLNMREVIEIVRLRLINCRTRIQAAVISLGLYVDQVKGKQDQLCSRS